MTKIHCPNCCKDHDPTPEDAPGGHRVDACVLGVFATIISERANLSEEKIDDLIRRCDADALWNAVGPVIDALEDGEFSFTDEEMAA